MTIFEKNIESLDFHFKKKNDEGGVMLTQNYLLDSKLSPQEVFALEIAKEKFYADAVYFRYFNDGRGPVPQIYIYDNTGNHLTDVDVKNIHKRVWSGCQVPIFIIVQKTEVQVYDAREKVKADISNLAFDTIKLTGTVLSQFSAKSFDDGLFWENNKNENHFQFSTSAYRDLITGLKAVYTDFQKNSGLNSHVALKLLVQCLLIKYLEERDEQSDTGYFAKTYLKKNFNAIKFCDVIRAGKLLDLLDHLAKEFNGKIFEWSVDDEKKERKAINQSGTTKLADYLDGNIQNHQFVLWRLYSFSHLPVELISSVYEELLTNSKDIVYTPEMIVATMVDECMPLTGPKKNFKLIDVSCGSGIFLVKAYKRLIQWWRYEKWQETGKLIKPSLAELKQILTSSIYGIDIEEDAIRLTVFSLALALLDEVDLDPPTWQKLKFPNLSEKNIVVKDFFQFVSDNQTKDFDLVIGNPPFNPPTLNNKVVSKGDYFEHVFLKYKYKSEIKIPYKNPALHFLVQGMKLLKKNALLCLVQPSGPLLYQKDVDFKRDFFGQYNLLQIIDFTKLSDVLWGNRIVATAAVFVQNSNPDSSCIVHAIPNRTFSNLNRLFLEIDHYDFHTVDKEEIIANPNIWKINLLGGGRIKDLVDRLSKVRTLASFLEYKNKEGWIHGDGFKVEGKKRVKAPFITGKNFLPTEAFSEDGINWKIVKPCKETLFERPRSRKIYTPPHLLIKPIIGAKSIPIHFSNEYLVFKSKIIGVHAPESQKTELRQLYNYLTQHTELFRFYIGCTGSQQMVNRATAILNEDLMALPYPEDETDIKISKAEKIVVNDVLQYYLKDWSILLKDSTENQMKAFATVFCKTLNSVYEDENRSFRLFKILDTKSYFTLHFVYTNDNPKISIEKTEDLEQYIQKIIPTEKKKGKRVHTQRVFKVFAKDTIILVKPKQLRYWLQSIALRDADETLSDYIKARYH